MTDAVIPEAFLEQVKEVLENLYDFPFLNRHTLAASSTAGQPTEPAGHRLRRELVDAIESLNPGAGAARSNNGRIYNLLHMHYVGSMTLQEAANDLGISVRQAYRDLRQGHESVGYVLWYRRESDPPPEPAEPVEPVQDELATNVHALLEAAIKAVQRLAEQANIRLRVKMPSEPIIISTHQAAAQQIFIHLLSQTIQGADEGEVAVELKAGQEDVRLELRYTPRDATPRDSDSGEIPITRVIQDFITQLHFQVTQEAEVEGARVLRLRLSARRPTLLIIDDHQGLIDLLQRYITGQSIKVLSASDAVSGLKMAEDIQPNAIIVDLMMPGMDGWELLQTLRTIPRTANIPVIICSVINDPELAYSLGASLFISKPVSRDSLLTALQQIGL